MPSPVEIHGESRPERGRVNQDAWAHGNQPVPWAAVCDGAGRAEGIAKHALFLLESGIKMMTLGQALSGPSWVTLTKSIDRALSGGAETTLVVAAVIGGELVGVAAGDSRALLVPLEGVTHLLGETSKHRLGSGEVDPALFHHALAPRDTLLLLSDGVYNSIGVAGIDRVVRASMLKPLADLPGLLLDSIRGSLADDATAVALRVGARSPE